MLKKSLATALTVTVLSISACAPSQTSRSAGQTLDDTTMTAKIKKEIGTSLGLSQAASINVDTYRGVVSLAGFVDSEVQIQAATQAAQGVPGVEKVFNNLILKPKS